MRTCRIMSIWVIPQIWNKLKPPVAWFRSLHIRMRDLCIEYDIYLREVRLTLQQLSKTVAFCPRGVFLREKDISSPVFTAKKSAFGETLTMTHIIRIQTKGVWAAAEKIYRCAKSSFEFIAGDEIGWGKRRAINFHEKFSRLMTRVRARQGTDDESARNKSDFSRSWLRLSRGEIFCQEVAHRIETESNMPNAECKLGVEVFPVRAICDCRQPYSSLGRLFFLKSRVSRKTWRVLICLGALECLKWKWEKRCFQEVLADVCSFYFLKWISPRDKLRVHLRNQNTLLRSENKLALTVSYVLMMVPSVLLMGTFDLQIPLLLAGTNFKCFRSWK